MRERLRKALSGKGGGRRPPVLSFGSWGALRPGEVVQVCHPDWRGIKAAAYAFGGAVVESDDLAGWSLDLVDSLHRADVAVVVVQGWPPGTDIFAEDLAKAGVDVRCVLHSSPALHGASREEASVVARASDLWRRGILRRVGVDKEGVSEALATLGFRVEYLPNRAPAIQEVRRLDLDSRLHVGIFAEPWWPKNVHTQVLAGLLLPDAQIHLNKDIDVAYLQSSYYTVHSNLGRTDFLTLLASMSINFNVSLTESYPMLPMESFLLGVPCLVSPTSALFKSDPYLWAKLVVVESDNPVAIANAASRALEDRKDLVEAGANWVKIADREAARRWEAFVS